MAATLTTDTPAPSRTRPYAFAAAGVLLLSGVVLMTRLGNHSVWGDEGFSISTSRRPFGELLRLSVETETTGAPYALLLHVWMKLGDSETALRSLSALLVLCAVAVVGWIANRLGGPVLGGRRAVIAMGLFGLHGTVVEYGQSIRFYALVLLVGAVSMAAFVADVERPGRLALTVWAVASVLLPACHLLASPVIGAQFLALLLLDAPRRRWRRRLPVFVAAGAMAAVVLSLVHGRDEGQDLVTFGLGALKEVALSLSGTGGIPALVVVAGGAAIATHALWLDLHDPTVAADPLTRFRLLLPVLWLAVPVVTLALLSLVQPAFLGRYLLVTVPGLMLLLAAAVDSLLQRSGRLVGALFLAAMISALSIGGIRWLSGQRGDMWRAIACEVREGARRGDAILFANDSVRLYFEYERTQPRPGCESGAADAAEPVPVFPSMPWGEYGTGDHVYEPFRGDDVRRALADHPRAWLVIERGIDLEASIGAPVSSFGEVERDGWVNDTARLVLVRRRDA